MGNLGFAEILVIAVIALLVFGPERLPELAKQAGSAVSKFRKEASKSVQELKRAADLDGLDQELRGLSAEARALRTELTQPLAGTPRPDDQPPPTDPDAT